MKEIKLKIPEYISIGQYQQLSDYDKLEPLQKMLKIITTLSSYTEEEVRQWTLPAIAQAAEALSDVTIAKNEFHAIVEFKGELYGFSNLSRNKFGEYIDIQDLLKDPINNLHQIAAVLYRPIIKHKFNSFSFAVKHGHKVVNNAIKDPFTWYTLDKYDSNIREERSELMKDFPVQLTLGAMGFISMTGTLSLNGILSSMMDMTKTQKEMLDKKIVEDLSQSIGAGGGLYINSRKPIYYQLPEIPVS